MVTLIVNPAEVTWTRDGEQWLYSYGSTVNGNYSEGRLSSIELVRFYFDNGFSDPYRLRDGGVQPEQVSFNPQSPQLDYELLPESAWQVEDFGFDSRFVTETYGAYYYPTNTDYHPPGIFGPNPHNAVVGDFNGDGREDIWINWVAFPHTVPRQTDLPPTVLMSSPQGLYRLDDALLPDTLNRQMAYRTVVADFDGDGGDDVAFGGMGIIERLPGGGYTNVWERNGIALFSENGIVDASFLLAGQEADANLDTWGFSHDASAGDVDGDGRGDFYAGGRLWVSNDAGAWDNATQYLPLPPEYGSRPPMSSAIGDLDGDGRDDIAVFWADFAPVAYAVLSRDSSYPNMNLVELPAPLFGANSKANSAVIGDLDGNGLGDIVVGTTRANPYYEGAALQIIMQTSLGVFADETSARIDNAPSDSEHGEGQLRLVDVNGDGLTDIVHSLDATGANIFLNDGTGHFEQYSLTNFPHVQSYQVEGLQEINAQDADVSKLHPIDANNDGLADFIGYVSMGDFTTQAGNGVALYTVIASEQSWGRQGSERLPGTSQSEHIRGYSGNDTLLGGGNSDTLDGGDGADILMGGSGADRLLGGAGADTVVINTLVGTWNESRRSVESGPANDRGQDTLAAFSLSEDTVRIVATNVSRFVHGIDTAIGTATGTANTGVQGDFSVLTGLIELNQTANDTWSDPGDVAITFDAPSAAFTEAAFEARLQYQLTGTAGANTLMGGGLADTLGGGAGNDVLNGYGGADVLFGGLNADVLSGGRGNDRLTGGPGLDIFRFNAPLNGVTNVDAIADFFPADDTIQLENSGTGLFLALATGALAEGAFRSGPGVMSARDADDRIIYNTTTGALYYDADGSGAASGPVKFAVLGAATHPALTHADFVVI